MRKHIRKQVVQCQIFGPNGCSDSYEFCHLPLIFLVLSNVEMMGLQNFDWLIVELTLIYIYEQFDNADSDPKFYLFYLDQQ